MKDFFNLIKDIDKATWALFISLFSLGISLFGQISQHKQWNSINMANVEMTDAKFILSKGFSEEEVNQKGYWGYKLSFQRDDTVSNLYKIKSSLTTRYLDTGKPIPGFNPVFRLQEAVEQIKLKGITENYVILKHYVVVFQYENLGKTEAYNLRTEISLENPIDKIWQNAFTSEETTNLSPGIVINTPIEYNLPLNMDHPDNINYQIKISYKDIHGKNYLKTILATFDNERNNWSYKKS